MNKFEMPNVEIVSFTQFDAIADNGLDIGGPTIGTFDSNITLE